MNLGFCCEMWGCKTAFCLGECIAFATENGELVSLGKTWQGLTAQGVVGGEGLSFLAVLEKTLWFSRLDNYL